MVRREPQQSPSYSVMVVLWLLLLSGCAALATPDPELPATTGSVARLRDREAALAVVRVDLAAARIAAAKKEAELQELRQVVAQLRQENAAAHQALLTLRREVDERQANIERRQVEQVEASQARKAETVSTLERTVAALMAEVGQLKDQLDHVTVAVQGAHDPSPSGTGPRKRVVRQSQPDIPPALPVAGSLGGGMVSTTRMKVDGVTAESTTQITVQPRDTLWKIARRHHVSLAEIRRGNRLEGDVVQAGQLLIIPAPSPNGP